MMLDAALKALNIPTAKFEVASSIKDAERFAKKFGFPVVLKLISTKVSHKTEAGGVIVARDPAQLREAATKLAKQGKILVQEFCEGTEFFIGIKKDATFGHVLLAGLGGIFVEVYKDVAFRVCPITRNDAESMLDELKGKAILAGVRGQKPINRKALVDAMVLLSELPKKLPNMQELDVNPFIINDKQGVAVDARIVLK